MDSFNEGHFTLNCEAYFHGLTINELIILQVRIPPLMVVGLRRDNVNDAY